jgi:hypothetical protein
MSSQRVNRRPAAFPGASARNSGRRSDGEPLEGDTESAGDPLRPSFAVAMITSAVPVVCAAGALDRDAVEELRGTLRAHLRLCVDGAALICDLTQARVFDPVVVARMLTDTAVRAAGHLVRLFVLPCPGLRMSSSATLPGRCAAGTFTFLDDMTSGVHTTCDPEVERDDHQVRRILDRTIRHGLGDLRSQPPYETLDPATCQALRWRLTDAAQAGIDVGPRLLAAAAGVRRARIHLDARQHRDAYFALLDAEDHLRAEPTSAEPPIPAVPPRLPAPRAPSTLLRGTTSGPAGGRRRRVSSARQLHPAVTLPAGGCR